MDAKVLLLSSVLVIVVNCQYGVKSIIDQTQQLQDIEKYGSNFTERPNFYPRLDNLTDTTSHFYNKPQNSSLGGPIYNNIGNTSMGFNNNTTGAKQLPFNSTERFLNKTMTSMPKGVCVKEVPTASLLKQHEVVVAGNGSNPTLSLIQTCCQGYQRNIHNFRKCDPVCENECINGFCSAPNTCVCYPDHVRNLAGFCLATCPIGCGNGFCNPDNTCACKDGFSLEPYGKFCIPKCTSGCFNGNCTAPEVCTCDKGFLFTSAKRCEPSCSRGCKNGDCVAPEVCNCHQGYKKVGDVCQPICTNGCLNGFCVGPNVCECPGNGWNLDATGSQCVASCDKPCLNGVCSGPNTCTCLSGYGSDNFDKFRCVPKCEPPCVNGVCSGPNLCLCYQGYIKDRSLKGSQRCIKA